MQHPGSTTKYVPSLGATPVVPSPLPGTKAYVALSVSGDLIAESDDKTEMYKLFFDGKCSTVCARSWRVNRYKKEPT